MIVNRDYAPRVRGGWMNQVWRAALARLDVAWLPLRGESTGTRWHGTRPIILQVSCQGSEQLKRTNLSSLRAAAPESIDFAATGIASAR